MKVEELIKNWKTYDPNNISDAVLRDDWRIVHAWMTTLCKRKKRFTSPQFKDYTLEEQIKIVKRLREKIRKEMQRRGWRPKEELWKLPVGMNIDDIDVPYVNKLSDKELLEVYRWLHKIYPLCLEGRLNE